MVCTLRHAGGRSASGLLYGYAHVGGHICRQYGPYGGGRSADLQRYYTSYEKLADAAHRIADGELNVETGVRSKDEIGRVASAMERTVSKLKDYIKYINETTRVLDEIADEYQAN